MKVLPPLTILLQIAWRNYIRRFDVILFANLIIALPFNIALDLTSPRHLYDTTVFNSATTVADIVSGFSQLVQDPLYVANLGLQIIASVCSVYVAVAVVITMRQIYQRKPWPAGLVLQTAIRYIPAAVIAVVMVRIAVLFGFIFFIIPGIIFGLLFSLTIPALVWHNLGPWQAMRRSYQAVRKNWWTVFAYMVIVNFLVAVVTFIIITAIPDVIGFTTLSLTIASIISSFVPLFSVIVFAALDLDIAADATTQAPTL